MYSSYKVSITKNMVKNREKQFASIVELK